MRVVETGNVRNVAFVGHGHAGKTSLISALLYATRDTEKLGTVAEGTAVTDFDPDEIERKLSMAVAVASCIHGEVKLNLIDTPGSANFIGDAAGALHVAESAVLLVHAVDGIAVQTEKMWDDCTRLQRPVMFVVSQIDRENADFEQVANALGKRWGRQAVPVTLPIGNGPSISGVVDLFTQQAFRPKSGTPDVEIGPAPDTMKGEIKTARDRLIEVVAESSDELMNEFLETGDLRAEDLIRGFKDAFRARRVFPIFATAHDLIGVHQLGFALVGNAPTPLERENWVAKDSHGAEQIVGSDPKGPFVAQVFKTYIDAFAGHISLLRIVSGTATAEATVWNADRAVSEKLANLSAPHGKSGAKLPELKAGDIAMVFKMKDTQTGDTLVADKAHLLTLPPIAFPRPVIAYAVHGEAKGDDEKIQTALQKLAEEDRTLKLDRDRRSHELLLMGMGYDHVKGALDKAQRRYHTKAHLERPKVPYLETITKKSSSMYRHKKQTGGAGQFAEVHMRIEPLPRGEGFHYDSEIFGGSISRGYWPSIEKGVKSVLEAGVIAGYPLVDVKAVIFDGKEHPVDSKDIAFQVAGREAFKLCVREAGAVVLEPVMRVTVTSPEDLMGDILGDLTRRRGKVQGSESEGGRAVVKAQVPMAEMLEYSATLKSLTSDRGSYSMELDHYERVPAELQAKLVAEHKPHDTHDD